MKTTEAGTDRATAQACPSCGMQRGEWPNQTGFVDDQGKTHCCEGCATGEGCTCN
jgi:hypothetical protein